MSDSNLIFEIENFISNDSCNKIVSWFKDQKKEDKNSGNNLFDNRTIPYSVINDNKIKQIVNAYKYDVTFLARKLFNKSLYPDYTDLVYWPSGLSMDVHADAVWLDGTPARFPYRYCAGVCYLNDDYEGGETFFPNFNIEIKPKIGKLVLFPANLEYQHGVKEVKGERYTMPIWFSKNSENLEL